MTWLVIPLHAIFTYMNMNWYESAMSVYLPSHARTDSMKAWQHLSIKIITWHSTSIQIMIYIQHDIYKGRSSVETCTPMRHRMRSNECHAWYCTVNEFIAWHCDATPCGNVCEVLDVSLSLSFCLPYGKTPLPGTFVSSSMKLRPWDISSWPRDMCRD